MIIVETKDDVELYDLSSNTKLKKLKIITDDELFIEYNQSVQPKSKGILFSINDYVNNKRQHTLNNHIVAKVSNVTIDNYIIRGRVELYYNPYINHISDIKIYNVEYIPRIPMVEGSPRMITKLLITNGGNNK